MNNLIIRAIELFCKVINYELTEQAFWIPSDLKTATRVRQEFMFKLTPKSKDQFNLIIGGSYLDNRLVIDFISIWKIRVTCSASNLFSTLQAVQGLIRKGLENHAYLRFAEPIIATSIGKLSEHLDSTPFLSNDRFLTNRLANFEGDLPSQLNTLQLFRLAPHVLMDTTPGLLYNEDQSLNADSLLLLKNWTRYTDPHTVVADEQVSIATKTKEVSVRKVDYDALPIVSISLEETFSYSMIVTIA